MHKLWNQKDSWNSCLILMASEAPSFHQAQGSGLEKISERGPNTHPTLGVSHLAQSFFPDRHSIRLYLVSGWVLKLSHITSNPSELIKKVLKSQKALRGRKKITFTWPQTELLLLLLSCWSCLTLCDPLDCSPSGSSVHRIFQARILEWVAHFLFQGIFLTQGSDPRFFTSEPPGKSLTN